LWAKDVNAKDLAVFCIGDNLHKAVVIAQDGGFRVTGEREFAHLHFIPFFFGLRFRQAR